MRIWRINIYIVLFINLTIAVKGQSLCDTLPFIQCQDNLISINGNNSFNTLFQKFKNLNSDKGKPIHIVHIGDSHLQAGFLSEKIKQNLFQFYSEKNTIVSPGFIFPFTIAQTNNPFFYKVDYSGDWEWCKNIDVEKTFSLGLSGITIRTNDSVAFFSIKMQNEKYDYPKKYFFNTVKIFHNADSAISIKVNDKKVISKNAYSLIQLNNLTDSISVSININDTSSFFELYGIILENDKSKINYHTIGVNGATAQSYLKCNYFSNHLAIINPDLIIISLGTNDAYDDDLSIIEHEYILKDLILQIKDVAPNTPIILVTPNDHLKNGEFSNNKILLVRDNILKTCAHFQLSFWDFYSIMGGENAIIKWYEKGLSSEDKLHFKRTGYEIQGELFAKALIDLIEKER
jgi:lysophospholipase L1-like esterase